MSSVVHKTNIEIKIIMPQVVVYRRIKTCCLKKRSQSLARGSNCSDLGGESLVFWICGRFWEVVARGSTLDCGNHRYGITCLQFSYPQVSLILILNIKIGTWILFLI